jgi:hypothetical protein
MNPPNGHASTADVFYPSPKDTGSHAKAANGEDLDPVFGTTVRSIKVALSEPAGKTEAKPLFGNRIRWVVSTLRDGK